MEKPHMVWIKAPFCEAEVKSRHSTRELAEKAAKALEKSWGSSNEYGPITIWVESPGTIEALLREMHEGYEEGR